MPKGKAKAPPPPPNTAGLIGMELEFHKRFHLRLGRQIGAGGFGVVHFGDSVETGERFVVKMESTAAHGLYAEIKVLQNLSLQRAVGSTTASAAVSSFKAAHGLTHLGLPVLFDFRPFELAGMHLRVAVIEAYEGSISSKKPQMTPVDYLAAAAELLYALQYVHERGYSHGDVKADNICYDRQGRYYLIDFGVADLFCMDGVPAKYPATVSPQANGTIEYVSLDAHYGLPNTARGDLEILGYNLLQWLGGTLPWRSLVNGMRPEDHQHVGQLVLEEKLKFNKAKGGNGMPVAEARRSAQALATACQLKGCSCIVEYFTVIFSLAYNETPDYDQLRAILAKGKSEVPSRGAANGAGSAAAAAPVAERASAAVKRKGGKSQTKAPAPTRGDEQEEEEEDDDVVLVHAVDVEEKVPAKKARSVPARELAASLSSSAPQDSAAPVSRSYSQPAVAPHSVPARVPNFTPPVRAASSPAAPSAPPAVGKSSSVLAPLSTSAPARIPRATHSSKRAADQPVVTAALAVTAIPDSTSIASRVKGRGRAASARIHLGDEDEGEGGEEEDGMDDGASPSQPKVRGWLRK